MSSKSKKKKESKTAYMCGTAFAWDLCDDNAHYTELYGSISALKRNKTCFNECGIVKVTVTKEKVVKRGKF